MLTTAPISSPPGAAAHGAQPFRIGMAHGDQMLCAGDEIGMNVFFFLNSLPSSYHQRPSSSPPRTCAMAYANPRSRRLRRAEPKDASMLMPYEP